MNQEGEKSFTALREKYPKYFDGLRTLSDYQKKLDDALDELKKTNDELGNVKNANQRHPETMEPSLSRNIDSGK